MSIEGRLQAYVLTLLYVSEEMSFTDLYKELVRLGVKVTKGNLQHHLERLRQEGLVERSYVPFFLVRRKVVYRVTGRGVRALREFLGELSRLERMLYGEEGRCVEIPGDDLWVMLRREAERRGVGVSELVAEMVRRHLLSNTGEGQPT